MNRFDANLTDNSVISGHDSARRSVEDVTLVFTGLPRRLIATMLNTTDHAVLRGSMAVQRRAGAHDLGH